MTYAYFHIYIYLVINVWFPRSMYVQLTKACGMWSKCPELHTLKLKLVIAIASAIMYIMILKMNHFNLIILQK